MKQYFLHAAGLVALVLNMQLTGLAQQDAAKAGKEAKADNEDIIISVRGEKDVKLNVEIKDGKVFINGKPAEQYSGDHVKIRRKIMRDQEFTFRPDMHQPPMVGEFNGNLSLSGDGDGLVTIGHGNSAFLGVSSEQAEGKGAKITGVSKESAAEKAGLQKGDEIVRVDDKEISHPEDLSKVIHGYKPGDKVTVTYTRDGKEQKVQAELGKGNTINLQSFKINMPDLEELRHLQEGPYTGNFQAPRAFSWNSPGRPKIGIHAQDTEEGKGAKVLDVDDESPADKAGIRQGDIITEFDGKPVNDAGELANLSRAAREKNSFKIKFLREDKTQEVEVKIPRKLKTADL